MLLTRKSKLRRDVIINIEPLESRAAILEDGRLEHFFIERPTEARLVGSIFKGRIQNLDDGLQAAFVDIGLKKNAFIHYWDMIPEDAARLLEADEGGGPPQLRRKRRSAGEIAKRFPVGSEIVVQVTKDVIGTKGPRVTANLSIPGRYLVIMPGSNLKGVSRKIEDTKERERLKKIIARLPARKGIGIIARTAAEGVRKTSFVRDLANLIDIWEEVEEKIRSQPAPCLLYQEPDLAERVVRDSLTEDVSRIIVDSREVFERLRAKKGRISRRLRNRIQLYDGPVPIFEHFDVERQLEHAFRRRVWLKSGGYITVDETEALVAIDVNTGRHKSSSPAEDVMLTVNLEAVEEIARQLRLRNIGGLVVVDFIDMRQSKNQRAVFRALKKAMQQDRARTNLMPISPLGLLEMTRQRAEESIHRVTSCDCPYCHGRGKVKNPLTMSIEVQRRVNAILKSGQACNLRITVHPGVLDRMRRQDEDILLSLQERYGANLSFVANPACHMESFIIQNADTGEELFRAVPPESR
ncbi:MAG TPA: Rne/Rng family ribonuclease [Kiritimatiellae bacterium]|nr:Rne/Rng family ribonuclease [Kiritimatiellia bacterium]